MRVVKRGNILYFPGCEPKDTVPAFMEDPIGTITATKKRLEAVDRNRTIVPIFYSARMGSLIAAYRIDTDGKSSYWIHRHFVQSGKPEWWPEQIDLRRVRAMYRYLSPHRFVDFETAFPGVERNKRDIAVFGPSPVERKAARL